ncbi:MAG: hypothetical protein OIF40_07435, partial [Mangrovicoccus sp.]|nr:hypothetical protein [Mangrovicoccus sp.]
MILCVVLAGLVYFLGHKLGMRGIYPFKGDGIRFWVSLVLMLMGAILLIVHIWQWVVAWKAGREPKEPREPTIEELEAKAMDDTFAAAVRMIRNRWSGKGRRIYGLPWYLML